MNRKRDRPPESGEARRSHEWVAKWQQARGGRVRHAFEPIVIAATLALIPVLIIETDAKSEGWQRFANVADWPDRHAARVPTTKALRTALLRRS